MRAERGIFSPARPSGYPVPSHFSWWRPRHLHAHLHEAVVREAGEDVGQDVGPDEGVGLHDVRLLRGETHGLEEDVVGDADLADVVEGAGVEDVLDEGIVDERRRIPRSSPSLAARARQYRWTRVRWLPVSLSRNSASLARARMVAIWESEISLTLALTTSRRLRLWRSSSFCRPLSLRWVPMRALTSSIWKGLVT